MALLRGIPSSQYPGPARKWAIDVLVRHSLLSALAWNDGRVRPGVVMSLSDFFQRGAKTKFSRLGSFE